jgi:hypothetical protein
MMFMGSAIGKSKAIAKADRKPPQAVTAARDNISAGA